MEQAKKFFEEILKTDEAKELLASMEKPETDEARIQAYVEVAGKLGVELTAEEILAYFGISDDEELEAGELDDEELAQLVGGGDECSSTYLSQENCWWNDGCDIILNSYDDYVCGTNATDKPRDKRPKRKNCVGRPSFMRTFLN